MSKIALIFVVAIVIALFSALTLGELWVLRELGFDIIAHLKATYESGDGTKFHFEAFGVIAVVVGQPILL